MATYIHCPKCSQRMAEVAARHGECYEAIAGSSIISDIMCDSCGGPIDIGDRIHAAVLLPSNQHFNYQSQKPDQWADKFIKRP